MYEEKKAQIIQRVMGMSDCEVSKLEVFITGMRAGEQIDLEELEPEEETEEEPEAGQSLRE